MDDPSSPENPAITLRIKFKSATPDEFVTRYGADVSAGGIFVRTKKPLAVGSILHFDFALGDGTPLMAGIGTVVWVREGDASRAGSVPGMGLRFDQLTPDGQQAHQRILAIKARRGDRTMVTPPPIPTFASGARPAPKPATPAPATARTPAPSPTAAPPPVPASSGMSDDFGFADKTAIADRPPSFYFEGVPAVPAGGREPAQEAAPTELLEDKVTDSQPLVATESSLSGPIDLGEDTGGGTPASVGSSAEAAASRVAGEPPAPTSESLDLMPAASPQPTPAGAPPAAQGPSPTADQARAVAAPVDDQNWLARAMNATAVPVETAADNNEKVPASPESLSSREAGRPAPGELDALSGTPADRTARKSGKQGTKLITLGIVAAGVAFAGVYLMQARPWQTVTEPAPPPQPRAVGPGAPPAPAKPGEANRPTAQPPAPAPEKGAVAAQPVQPASPAVPVAAPGPSTAPAKGSEPAAEAAKPGGESTKHPGRAGAAAKRGPAAKSASSAPVGGTPAPSTPAASAPAPSAPASAPAPSGQGEDIYFVKVKSTPPGAQVLIDGDPMGPTPFQRRILDMSKPHVVTVRKPGYDSYEKRITASDAWVKSGNTSTLDVKARLVRLRSQPGARTAAPEKEASPASDQPEKL